MSPIAQAASQEKPEIWKYCVFCATGKEMETSLLLSAMTEGKAYSPRLVCQVKRQGVWSVHEYVFLPGYVFLFCQQKLEVAAVKQNPLVLKLLHYGQGGYELRGADAAFAQWIYEHDGVIGKSKAIREGCRIRVVEGPMLRFCDRISTVNKQRRRAKVVFDLNGASHAMWMAFDWVDTAP